MAEEGTCSSSGGLGLATFYPRVIGIGSARKTLPDDFGVAGQGKMLDSHVLGAGVSLKETSGAVVAVSEFPLEGFKKSGTLPFGSFSSP